MRRAMRRIAAPGLLVERDRGYLAARRDGRSLRVVAVRPAG
jgi:hypothetical protein